MKRSVPAVAAFLSLLLSVILPGCSGGGPSTGGGSTSSTAVPVSKTNPAYNLAPSVDCSAWMSNIPALENATLLALTLPGTHDAGAYGDSLRDVIAPTVDGQRMVDAACGNIDDGLWGPIQGGVAEYAAIFTRRKGKDFGRTQHLDLRGQLRSGIRFLDLRVAWSVDGFYIHHGLLGYPVASALEDVASYMAGEAGPREVVLLSFANLTENNLPYPLNIQESSDDPDRNVFVNRRVCGETVYRDMSTARHEELIGMIGSRLGPFLHRRSADNAALQGVRIGDIVRGGPKVVVFYPKGGYGYPDFLWSAPVDTEWANKDTLEGLESVQQPFLDNHVAAGDSRLLELQWVLTAQEGVVTLSTECEMWKYFNCDKGLLEGYNVVVCPILADKGKECKPHPYDSTHDLSLVANPALGEFVYRPDQAKLNLLRVDFSDESPAVDIALDSPVAVCADVTVPADGYCRADASVDDGSSDNMGSITLVQAPPGPYPLGETPVELTVSDGRLRSSCGAVVTVVDNTPPVIRELKGSPDELWPPNHRMVPISIRLDAVDNCDPKPACRISRVRSNEPEGKGEGAGNFAPDWVVRGELGLELRAERSGSGDDRYYEVTVECVDRFGNAATGSFTVEVPHSASE